MNSIAPSLQCYQSTLLYSMKLLLAFWHCAWTKVALTLTDPGYSTLKASETIFVSRMKLSHETSYRRSRYISFSGAIHARRFSSKIKITQAMPTAYNKLAEKYSVSLNAFVFMTSHVHLLTRPTDESSVSGFMQYIGDDTCCIQSISMARVVPSGRARYG